MANSDSVALFIIFANIVLTTFIIWSFKRGRGNEERGLAKFCILALLFASPQLIGADVQNWTARTFLEGLASFSVFMGVMVCLVIPKRT